MICPRCSAPLDTESTLCAECGVNLFRNVSGIVKTSIVMISTGDESNSYPSVNDVPEPLRRQLIESTSGGNSGMIVIADRAGRDHLTQGFARRLAGTIESASRAITENPTGVSAIGVSATGVTAIVPAELPDRPEPIPKLNSWVAWAGFGIVLALIILTAVFFGMRW